MMPLIRSLLLALVLAPVAFAQTPTRAPVTFYGVTFPAEIADAVSISVREYEQTSPGLGYSVGYRGANQTSTVYIYDMRQSAIPDDLQAPIVKAQFEQAKGDIFGAGRQGLFTKVEAKEDWGVADARGRTRFTCTAFVLAARDRPGELDSHVCLGVVNNKFFKFRITGSQRPGATEDAKAFVEAWARMIWPDS
jgi:hypothetical protein